MKPTTQNETRMRKPNTTSNPAKRRKRRRGEVQTIKEKTGCYRVKAVVAVEPTQHHVAASYIHGNSMFNILTDWKMVPPQGSAQPQNKARLHSFLSIGDFDQGEASEAIKAGCRARLDP